MSEYRERYQRSTIAGDWVDCTDQIRRLRESDSRQLLKDMEVRLRSAWAVRDQYYMALHDIHDAIHKTLGLRDIAEGEQ